MRYVLVYSDPAAADLDRLNFALAGRDPAYAVRWNTGLLADLDGLTGFPGPLSHARDEEASALHGREVRRLLYHGPTLRRTGTPVRVLFRLLPPAEDDPDGGETVILVLRLLRGAQALSSPEGAA